MTTANANDLPVDAILMELARAYVQQGTTEDARKTFTEIIENTRSPHSAEARTEPENLKGWKGVTAYPASRHYGSVSPHILSD